MTALITGTIGLAVAFTIVYLLRRDKLHTTHALSWLIIAGGFAMLGLAPGIIDTIARNLGIAYPPVLALLLAIAAIIIKLLIMDIEFSRLQVRHQRLVQRVALFEAELKRSPESGSPHDSGEMS